MTDHTDNDGAPITAPRFSADDAERPKFIRDATLDSDELGLEVVGWWPEGDASRYAERISAMLNEAVRLRKDAERYRLLRRGQKWSVIDGIGDALRAEELDSAIDGAREEAGHG